MKVGQVQVVGVVEIIKDDKKSYVVHGITPFEDWETGVGFKTFNEWTRADLSKVDVNDIIEPVSQSSKGVIP